MTVTTVLGPESREFTGSTIALPRTVVSDEHVPLLPVVVNATQAAMKRSQCRSSPAPSAAAARSCSLEATLELGDKENSVEVGQCSQVSTGMWVMLRELNCMLVSVVL